MDFELTDRVVIVTGASAGIGRAVVELLTAEERTSSALRATRKGSTVRASPRSR